MLPFGQVLTAMITPFTENGQVDYEKVWRLARHLTDHGSDGLVVTGTTGESPTLSAEEKVAIYRTVIESVAGRDVRVVAGTGTYDTAESVHLTRRAAEAGAHGLLAVTPYYSRPSQEGLIAHFEAIADASDLPVMLYNIPGRTARRIEVETLKSLSEPSAHPGGQGRRDGSRFHLPHLSRSAGALGLLRPGLLHMADDGGRRRRGGLGDLPSGRRQVAAMVAAAVAGDLARARDLHHQLLPLAFACFIEPNPSPVKAALNSLWEPVGAPGFLSWRRRRHGRGSQGSTRSGAGSMIGSLRERPDS